MRSYVDEKSNAPPSLKVILSSTKAWFAGILPPGTGFKIPAKTFAPKKGAVTWVSWRFRIGAENDWKRGVDATGRYTS